MWIRRLWLRDFRSYTSAEVVLSPALTAVVGNNGAGKTNLIEAIAWLATLSSFRGASSDAMIRRGQPAAVIRAEVEREGRELLIEAELSASGRKRVQVNRQALRRGRDLLGALRVTVFSPDDLDVIKGGPSERRRFIDDALVAYEPRHDALRVELDRVLRQRNALLRSAAGSLDETARFTLEVWNTKLVEVGETLADARAALLEKLRPVVSETYASLAGGSSSGPGGCAAPDGSNHRAVIGLAYRSEWREQGLAEALRRAQADDIRRGVSTVGPHRDEILLSVDELPARSQASQGEQRTLALALRLAIHRVVTEVTASAPVLLLDDVFSELDLDRGRALLANLPAGQVVVTTASRLPTEATPDRIVELPAGALSGTEPASTSTRRPSDRTDVVD